MPISGTGLAILDTKMDSHQGKHESSVTYYQQTQKIKTCHCSNKMISREIIKKK